MWWHQEQLAGQASAEGSEEEGICCWVWGSLAPVARYAPRHFAFLGWDVLDFHAGGALGRRGWEQQPPLHREVAARGLDALPPPLSPSFLCAAALNSLCALVDFGLLLLALLCGSPASTLSLSVLIDTHKHAHTTTTSTAVAQACGHKTLSCTQKTTACTKTSSEKTHTHLHTHTHKHNPHCCENTNTNTHK